MVFLPRHSTCSQLLECVNDWSIALNCRKSVDFAYIVEHSKLLATLQTYGISGRLFDWISAFLSNRTQQVRVGNSLSQVHKVLSGLPDGSVLGPVLFIVCISDIVDIIN